MALAETFVWDEASYIRAWEAGVFGEQRVELVEGQVIRVVIGDWHGQVTARVIRRLPEDGWRVTNATLPAAGSLPDPDAFVCRRGAEPVARLGTERTISRLNPGDVGLVVEVADASFVFDTEVKTVAYGRAGFGWYWVVHREGVEVFTDPDEGGYRERRHVGPDGEIEVPYAPGTTIPVAELLDVDQP
ncbi:Uma2 family endonuclease [Iamia sp. SCSIO 61187]|uniref:Uma2 family endonuclease n=1 Tax=Iamia sp. SCSIO 61187 TaxID=2722752 RepID=UPI001C634576|nr:Uma2 family endonuclease [Iamia sp. SCSIO 61187]QYG92365.1 Uma2 family endonuclease [Iamia sp. SCSIO 61187]